MMRVGFGFAQPSIAWAQASIAVPLATLTSNHQLTLRKRVREAFGSQPAPRCVGVKDGRIFVTPS